jgi:hypothetical protein
VLRPLKRQRAAERADEKSDQDAGMQGELHIDDPALKTGADVT